ncbi:MAG: hypothetical protein WCO13_10485 [Bacteroidota bacterium]
MSEKSDEFGMSEKIQDRLDYLERRIAQLETLLGVRKVSQDEFIAFENDKTAEALKTKPTDAENESAMETKIGELGLGWLGSIVLLFGISFITQYIQSNGQPLFSTLFGYFAVGIVFFISHYIRKSIPDLSSKLNIISYILLFYVTLRLHFFTNFPLISESFIPLMLLVIISAVQFYMANKNRSEFLAIIALILLLVTANISNTTHFMLILVVLSAMFSVYLLYKNNWWKLMLTSQMLTYLSFVIWYLVNVNTDKVLPNLLTDHNSIAYVYISVSVFSLISLLKKRLSIPDAFFFISIILNGLLFTFILTMYVVTFYLANYIGIFLTISIICLLFSVFLKKYSEIIYAPALYALYGFVSISTAIYGIFGLPFAYFLLSIQSLLVVSMAIWFRSKIIVFMNVFLFIFLLVGYYASSESIHSINFSFAVIAIVSARVINLQSKRLDIKTDLIRNVYLVIGFFAMLYALYKAVPLQYVILSWTIVAVVYFILSILIHNIKYRWMAIFTMVAAAIYLFVVDLASVGIIYRIFAFMFLAVISIAISVYYSKNKKKSISEDTTDNQSV